VNNSRPRSVLPRYGALRTRALAEPAATLRAAALWERLSVGTNVVFTSWVRAVETGQPQDVQRALAAFLLVGLGRAALSDVELTEVESALAKAASNLRIAVRLHDELCSRGVSLPGSEWFDLARHLLILDDAAFDAGLISFADTGAILFSDRFAPADRETLGVRPDLALTRVAARHLPNLAWHRAHMAGAEL